MSIIRKHRRSAYTCIDNATLQDSGLSWKATGMLAYLLSMPDGWNANYRDLARRKTDGEASARSGMQELEDAGYLVRQREHQPDGTFAWVTHVFETPATSDEMLTLAADAADDEPSAPCGDSPRMGNPGVEDPGVEDQRVVSNQRATTQRESTQEVPPLPPRRRGPNLALDGDGLTFAAFWKAYPSKRGGRLAAEKAWKARMREGCSAEEIHAGLQGYLARIAAEGTDERHVMHGATFVGPNRRWEEYIGQSLPAAQRASMRGASHRDVSRAVMARWLDEERAAS